MSVLLRARIASFMSGVAVTSVFAIYQLKKDLDESQEIVVKQVNDSAGELEKRIEKLEITVAGLQRAQQTQ